MNNEPSDKLSKRNLVILIPGLAIFFLGFIFLSLVGSRPEGVLGFIAPVTVLIGIVAITIGFIRR